MIKPKPPYRSSLVCHDCVHGRYVASSTVVPHEERNKPFTGMGAMQCDDCGRRRWVLYTALTSET